MFIPFIGIKLPMCCITIKIATVNERKKRKYILCLLTVILFLAMSLFSDAKFPN